MKYLIHPLYYFKSAGQTMSKLLTHFSLSFLFLTGLNTPSLAQIHRPAPEPATTSQSLKLFTAKDAIIVAANPYASKAGLEILNKGGNAIDAAIAVQLVLNLVEPQSSGIGGGGFLLYWENCKQNLVALDGREAAPIDASPKRFLSLKNKPLSFKEARMGRRSIGTPGLVKLLSKAHKKYGRLDWKRLFIPAIRLAKNGFKLSPRLHKLLQWRGYNSFGSEARAYFFDKAQKPYPVGHILKNPAFAATLHELASQGEKVFYQPGHALSQKIIGKVWRANERNLSYKDLASYKVIERKPVCTHYRGYKICSMGPPSSGAIIMAQVLKMTEGFPVSKTDDHTHQIIRLSLAEKLAYADRKHFIADPAFSKVPKGLLDGHYLLKRAKAIPPAPVFSGQDKRNIKPYRSILRGTVKAGKPPKTSGIFGKDASSENNGTSHISIIDAEGNVVSLTTTIEAGFGSGLMVGGFLLNNELTDFSFIPTDKNGNPVANRVEPRKRPRSSMSPTIIFSPTNKPFMVLGSPGGSRIPLYVLKSLVAVIDWGMNAQQAAAFPNFGSRNRKNRGIEIEKGKTGDLLTSHLVKSPLRFSRSSMNSGLHIIIRRKNHLEAGVDPRREGLAVGY